MNTYDIAILGAGPVGLTLALWLVHRGMSPHAIALIDAKTVEEASQDQRTIALSYGSRQLLERVGAWPIQGTEIHRIHVSRHGFFGRTLIDCKAHDIPALGYVARYGDIVKTLARTLEQRASELASFRPTKVMATTPLESYVHIALNDQQRIEAQLVVQAEGGLFNEQAPQQHTYDYQQTAIVAEIKSNVSVSAPRCAYERFTDQGPLALLPHDDGYALVWCVQAGRAKALLSLNDNDFLKQLQAAFGQRVGCFTTTTQRFAFPLGLNRQTHAPTGRLIHIGNASQTLHPVAGQGLNLGLRDAFLLAQELEKSMDPSVLQRYFARRQSDRALTVRLTDQLARIFTRSPCHHVKQTFLAAGLGVLDLFQPAQNWLAERMMFGVRN